jgi:hypothetical protein
MGSNWHRLLILCVYLLPMGAVCAQQAPSRSGKTRSPHGPLSLPCENCHTFTAWTPLRGIPEFDHNKTKYPLRGLHASVACKQCHVSLVFTNVGAKCADCHADIHRRQMGANCESCHTVKGWHASLESVRDHQNRFPLIGAHAPVDCDACHKGAAVSQFKGLSTDCVACHRQDYVQTRFPNHLSASFPVTCEQCHTMDSWLGATFDHAKFTGFALTGMHAKLDCAACHGNGNFQGTSANCISCHAKEYNAAQNPNHVQAGFPADCAICHSTSSWSGARFDHNAFTSFSLTGAHATVACAQCHPNGRYAGTPRNCASCHLSDYQKTTNPNHAAAGFPQDCAICHSTSSWSGARFDHNAFTSFSLTGAHATVACAQCHPNGRYAGTPRDCASCHLSDYQKTTNPNHAAAGFPQDCSICHGTTSWAGATFDHSRTSFPLTGAHLQVSCQTCHVNGNYSGLSTACVSCHLTNYNNTTNPNHQAAGLPQQCEVCHSTTAWTPASFDHSKTAFPLTGAHVTTPCASCHVGGRYAGTPTDCYSCHKSQYQTVTNPNHIAAGFPTNCALCHTTTTWMGATFTHSAFPIYSGTHQGRWTTCNDCHVNPSNYAVFSCTTCHAHDKTSMDDKHKDVRNYVYNSSNCYSCHPTGQAGG